MNNSDPVSVILNEHGTCFASGMERELLDLLRSIRYQEIFEPQLGNLG